MHQIYIQSLKGRLHLVEVFYVFCNKTILKYKALAHFITSLCCSVTLFVEICFVAKFSNFVNIFVFSFGSRYFDLV